MLIFNPKNACLELTIVYEDKDDDQIDDVFLVSDFGLRPIFHMLGKFNLGQKELKMKKYNEKYELTLCLPYNTITTYNLKLVYNDGTEKVIIDPTNKEKIQFINDYFPQSEISTNSIIRDPSIEITYFPHKKSNKHLVKNIQFYSQVLNNTRNLWLYFPPEYDEDKKYKLAIFFDGLTLIDGLPIVYIIDKLIKEETINPYVILFIGNIDWNTRKKELRLNNDFHKFLINEAIPLVQEHAKIYDKNIILGGFSYGGLASFYHSIKNPKIFSRIISLSGDLTANLDPVNSFNDHLRKRESIIKMYVKKDKTKLPKRVFQAVGLFEDKPGILTTILTSNREMNTLLTAKGIKNKYIEYNGGHELLHAHIFIEDAIKFIF